MRLRKRYVRPGEGNPRESAHGCAALAARPWSPAVVPVFGGSSRRWDVSRRTSAADSSSSPQHPPPPCAHSATSPMPTRGNSRCCVVPARGKEPTRAGSAGAAPRSSGLRSTTRCSSTRASALPVMGLGSSAA